MPTLFPEINFDDLKNEIVNEFLNQDMSSKEDAEEILGYRYGNSPEIHDDLPDHNEEIVVVYKDGQKVFEYASGYSDLENQTLMTGEEMFNIYSVDFD